MVPHAPPGQSNNKNALITGCSVLLVETIVKLAESLQNKCLLLIGDVVEFLNKLRSFTGALGDLLGRLVQLAAGLSLMHIENLSPLLLRLGLAFLAGEADGFLSGVTLLGCVMESGQVQWVLGELLASRSGTLWLDNKCTMLLC